MRMTKLTLGAAVAAILLAGCGPNQAPNAKARAAAAVELPPDPSGKYARCAGNTEPVKCRAMVDAIAAETPEAKAERVAKLENDRKNAVAQVAAQPVSPQHANDQNQVRRAPIIGMARWAARESTWGKPESINTTTTQSGTLEQWVYSNGNYLYFKDGVLTTIQERR